VVVVVALFGVCMAQEATDIEMMPCYSGNWTADCVYQNTENPNGTLYSGESVFYYIDLSDFYGTDNSAISVVVNIVSVSYGSVSVYLNDGDLPAPDDDDYEATTTANCSTSYCEGFVPAAVCEGDFNWYIEVENNGQENVNYEIQVLLVDDFEGTPCPSVSAAAWWDMFYLLYVIPFTVLTCCFCGLACCIRRRRCRQRAAYCKINDKSAQDAVITTRIIESPINGQQKVITTTYNTSATNGVYYPNPPQYYPGNNNGFFQEAPPPYLYPQVQVQAQATAPSYQYYPTYQQPQ